MGSHQKEGEAIEAPQEDERFKEYVSATILSNKVKDPDRVQDSYEEQEF